MLQAFAQYNLSSPAVWVDQRAISYQELFNEVNKVALELTKQGILPGHRVAFIANIQIHSIVLFLALLEIQATPCLLSPRLPLEQIPEYLQKAQASFYTDPHSLISQKRETISLQNSGEILLFTSGSSGTPKLAVLKPQHFLENAAGSVEQLGLLKKPGCWLLSVPLFHVSGLSILFRCLQTASAIALPSDFSRENITHLSWVPTQLFRQLDAKTLFPNLRCALIGGAPIGASLLQKAQEANLPLFLTYGMTEMASQITMTSNEDTLLPLHLGKALPGREIRFSQEGEILVRGACLFTGYDTEQGIYKPLIEGSWFPTGDLGCVDLNGNLHHKGRKDHLFISGGENIYPEAIERALGTLPNVLHAIVVPQEDVEFGQRPVAFVHIQGDMPSKEEFHEKLSSLLPRFSLPVQFLPLPQEEITKSLKWTRSSLTQKLQKIRRS
ncbi:MAG: AMP-binding protein [Rhabdochlamydiaceae bacterium]|nr:AMP-binding protein [Rhabdochlamydiaceae bacterium]